MVPQFSLFTKIFLFVFGAKLVDENFVEATQDFMEVRSRGVENEIEFWLVGRDKFEEFADFEKRFSFVVVKATL